MGHSIAEFRGQAFGTNDFKLEVWLKLLAKEIGREGLLPDWLVEAREHWATAGDWGVGCVDPQLDRYATDQERIGVLETLAERSLRALDLQGPLLTREFLNELVAAGPGEHFTTALDAEIFARVGRAFLGLLRGQFDRDATVVQWF